MQIKLPYIHFMNYSRQGLWFSTVLTIAAVLLIIVRGFNFGLEFTGGATIEMQYAQAADIGHVRSVVEKNRAGCGRRPNTAPRATYKSASPNKKARTSTKP